MDTQKTTRAVVVMPDTLRTDEVYVEEVGALVFESAIIQYFADSDKDQIEVFESYVTKNAAGETFMIDLCANFPEFEKLLIQEMEILNNDLTSVYPDAVSKNNTQHICTNEVQSAIM